MVHSHKFQSQDVPSLTAASLLPSNGVILPRQCGTRSLLAPSYGQQSSPANERPVMVQVLVAMPACQLRESGA